MRPFKNIFVYKFAEPIQFNAYDLEFLLAQYPLRECGKEELETYGWLPAFSQCEGLVESINNALFIRLGMFIKKLPRKAILTEVERFAREHEIDIADRSRFKELEEMITNDFIAKTFPEQDSICAYIDLEKGWLVVDAATEKKAALVTAVLRKCLESLPIVGYAPQVEMSLIMTDWVMNDLPSLKFGLLDEVDMEEINKEDGGKAKYRGIPLNSKEIVRNIEDGWFVTRTAMSYEEIVTFSLGRDFVPKRVRYLDQFKERLELSDDQNAVAQSNAYLLADTVRGLMTDLFNMCYGIGEEQAEE